MVHRSGPQPTGFLRESGAPGDHPAPRHNHGCDVCLLLKVMPREQGKESHEARSQVSRGLSRKSGWRREGQAPSTTVLRPLRQLDSMIMVCGIFGDQALKLTVCHDFAEFSGDVAHCACVQNFQRI